MRILVVMVAASCGLCWTSALPLALPQHLTEDAFLSSPIQERDLQSIDIVSGYANIRRQGRDFIANQKFKFSSKPLTVKNPLEFGSSSARSLNGFSKEKASPVFNLNDMLKKDALRLKAKIHEASLAAATLEAEKSSTTTTTTTVEPMIADEGKKVDQTAAEENQDVMTREHTTETWISSDPVQEPQITETPWKEASKDNEDIMEEEPEEAIETKGAVEEATVRDAIRPEEDEDMLEEKMTTEAAQPSPDIDLGSVQEV